MFGMELKMVTTRDIDVSDKLDLSLDEFVERYIVPLVRRDLEAFDKLLKDEQPASSQ